MVLRPELDNIYTVTVLRFHIWLAANVFWEWFLQDLRTFLLVSKHSTSPEGKAVSCCVFQLYLKPSTCLSDQRADSTKIFLPATWTLFGSCETKVLLPLVQKGNRTVTGREL